MRLLVDVHGSGWDEAWEITRKTFGYTNHTLLSEALENGLFRSSRASCPAIWRSSTRSTGVSWTTSAGTIRGRGFVRRLSLIDEGAKKAVRMANLACVGSRRINGVARLHTDLLREQVLNDFNRISPEKFLNVTNGVTPRRFMVLSNPALVALISECIGPGVDPDLSPQGTGTFSQDAAFRPIGGDQPPQQGAAGGDHPDAYRDRDRSPIRFFDVQVKRIHEYKRQHLNVLHVIALYNRICRGDRRPAAPDGALRRQGGPGYFMAKLIIKLIHAVAETIHADPKTAGPAAGSSSCPTSTSRPPTASTRRPISPSRSRRPARRPPVPGT